MQSSFDIPVEIWSQFCEGEGKAVAFSKIYYACAQDLFAYGLCITSDRDLIMDCIHDVFVNIYNLRETLQRENIRFYLMKALRNELYRAFRDAKETISLEECENELMPVHSAEDIYMEHEREGSIRNSVREMLSALTPNQREAIYHRYVEELSLQEISNIMGINYQSVQNLIQRSIQKQREKYRSPPPPPHVNYLLLVYYLALIISLRLSDAKSSI
ncbi:MAG: sigma-70 family RNA polymerase sigma factor [Tannerella sp.]|jgi:RNA polymerase sigma factor (sigma-70 family)|nr:sigma-70 family RNA polymerase sigma factor [Tannerella sp.]